MRSPCHERIEWSAKPVDVLSAWPRDRPLVALTSGGEGGGWARWSVFAAPTEAGALGSFEALDRVRFDAPAAPVRCPFTTGWIGFISYDAGRLLEPAARFHEEGRDDRGWSPMRLLRTGALLVHDAQDGSWWRVGDPALLPELDFDGPAPSAPGVSAPVSRTGRNEFLRGVERVLEDIRAGDVYQVNLSHRLTARFEGSARGLLASLLETGPWFGALIEDPSDAGRVVVSMSPELFLSLDARTREIVTRPIKGTRAISGSGGGEGGVVADLLESEKDAAELAMIVDLMRNDLGRVAEYGSVRVEDPRSLERHGSVLQAVATIRAELRGGASAADLLRASFPPGSITGAPKIRAMQIIDELEPVARGPYCGTIGYLGDDGSARLSVAIRTAAITGAASRRDQIAGEIDYPVGAGIVADSTPEAEWEETLAKAESFFAAARGAAGVTAAEQSS